ncbi:hypothetical protein BD310DRAFT_1043038 [Dichomitus squalens]|uniref:Uncharacterized protein n=1 Tax=Dichomitus squalens TaxID=114155 RepID=A0A4Q9PCG2_9APHY|nr:hypothetical protein BD310DRAFT_1043038 [Dichomitus squalens]
MAHTTSPSHSGEPLGSSPSPLISEPSSVSPSSPDFESFFSAADSELDVRRDIALLSYLLSHTKVKDRKSAADAKALAALDPWTYLAFIINTGEAPYDRAGNIAVTGRIDRDTITAALVARSTSPHRLPPDTLSLQIKSLKPVNPEYGASMLRGAIRNPERPSMECHIRDVITALNHFVHSPPASSAEEFNHKRVQAMQFFFFIAKRCCLKLRARIANGRRMWSAHPTSLIREWYASDRSRSLHPQTLALPAFLEQTLEKDYQLSPAAERRRLSGDRILYIVEPENVLRWAEMLVQCQDNMDKLFASLSQSSPEAQSLAYAAYISAAILDAVFQNGLLEILLTDGLARHMQEKYMETVGDLPPPMLNTLFMSLGAIRKGVLPEEIDTAAAEDPEVADPDDSEDELMAFENNKEHVIRYLKTLAIPFAAASFLVHYCHKLSPLSLHLEAFVVYASSSTPAVTQGHIREFKYGFLQHFMFPDEVKEEIDRALSSLKFHYNGSLHAEAIIMALACSVHNGVRAEGAELQQQQSYLTPVFEVPSIPIGVSKKCCFCCDLLAHLLMRSQSGGRLSFLLQGTHSTIFPWIPPDGIPFEVLKEMRIQLLKIFHSSITTYVKSVPSLQTSPAQSVHELFPLASPSDVDRLFS